MMRRLVVAAAVIAGASVASAQMPPSISKPIEQAKKAANATNAQMGQATQPAAPAPASQAKPSVPAPKAPAPGVKASAQATKAPAHAERSSKPQSMDSSKVTFEREVFTYVPSEIDPFASPMETGAIRPLVSDLKVVGIIYDPAGRNSVAVMRDQSTSLQYRAKVGQVLGRARVTQIKPQEVVLSIEEYGFSRQESLRLNVQQTQQTKGKP
jgi:hypothetical protein